MTWQFCAICCITCAMRSAIVPDTPVSISSKMMVGNFLRCERNALSDSMSRAISPPEAICVTSCSGTFLLALKRKVTLSKPLMSGAVRVVISNRRRAFGMPSVCSVSIRFSAVVLAAFFRLVVMSLPSESKRW